jgi:alpha-galactosidase
MGNLADHIHANGQRAGIYWEGGVPPQVWAANPPILGTRYHAQNITMAPVPPSNRVGYGPRSPSPSLIFFHGKTNDLA